MAEGIARTQRLYDTLPCRTDRWALLAAFASHFLRPFTAADSIPHEEIAASGRQLPRALMELYSLCGNASDIWCRQDEWLKPAKLKERNGVLIFWVENQGVWRIGIRLAELAHEDPPVVWDAVEGAWGVGAHGEYVTLVDSVSQFALNMLAYVAKFFDKSFDRPFGYAFDVEQVLSAISASYGKCQLQPEWLCGRESYFQDNETFIEVSESDGYVYPSFKTTDAARRLSSLLKGAPFQWDNAPADS